eukprot:COSAG04_NODE_14068_length_582_cov_0.645963_1_plen_70_part_10
MPQQRAGWYDVRQGWSADRRAAAAEHVHREGFVVLTHAVSASEVGAMADWVARSQAVHPHAWPTDERDGQ